MCDRGGRVRRGGSERHRGPGQLALQGGPEKQQQQRGRSSRQFSIQVRVQWRESEFGVSCPHFLCYLLITLINVLLIFARIRILSKLII